MKTRLEIIKECLISVLTTLSDESTEFESFFYRITDGETQGLFVSLVDKISLKKQYISTLLTFPEELEALNKTIAELKNEFPEFGAGSHEKAFLAIKLADLIKTEVESDPTFDYSIAIDIDLFDLKVLSRKVSHRFFSYFDPVDVSQSIILFDLKQKDDYFKFFEDELIPIELLFHLVYKLGAHTIVNTTEQYLMVKKGLREKSIEALLRLHLVKKGYYYHFPEAYSGALNIHANRKISSDRKYQQFLDTLLIFSEYNYQRDFLDKYLSLYQVVENFMFRVPLVELERANGGRPFSIRDFQRLFKRTNTSELDALKNLIEKVLTEYYEPTIKTFESFLLERWQNLPNGAFDDAKISQLMGFLNVTNSKGNLLTYQDVKAENIRGVYSQLIYYFRNSVVHNKDTELHLNHETLISHHVLGDSAKNFLEKFLIPTLEEIVFYLVIEENDIVRYSQPELLLWLDN
jgi:hypothetical protein